MITTDNSLELHAVGTKVRLVTDGDYEDFTVGVDGLWRNEYGQTPAGQVAAPPELPRCNRAPQLPPGRRSHGG